MKSIISSVTLAVITVLGGVCGTPANSFAEQCTTVFTRSIDKFGNIRFLALEQTGDEECAARPIAYAAQKRVDDVYRSTPFCLRILLTTFGPQSEALCTKSSAQSKN
ncbi:MAG: hypothetical protein RL417_1460 [Pseudomonadota bacterium]|jgi:hypothetical protein